MEHIHFFNNRKTFCASWPDLSHMFEAQEEPTSLPLLHLVPGSSQQFTRHV